MNRGFNTTLKHLRDGEWQPYGTTEGLPLIDATVTTPTVGPQEAIYTVIGQTVFFYMSINFDASTDPGEGTYVFLAPPVPIRYNSQFNGGTIGGFLECAQGPYGVKNATYPIAYIEDQLLTPSRIPLGRRMTCFPSPTGSYNSPGGTATVLSGTNAKVVTHGYNLTPESVTVTPLKEPRQAARDADPVRWWVSDIGDTTFKINVETEGTAVHYGAATVASGASTQAVTHGFTVAPSAVLITPKGSPAASGADASHIWVGTIGTSTFTINAQTAAGAVLTGSLAFSWRAMRNGFEGAATLDEDMDFSWSAKGPTFGPDDAGVYMTDRFPWEWSNDDRIDIFGFYPTAEVPIRF